ncbi:MAG: hypothetical protein DI539_06505 [Flavobacterium psychrophilum]|nr:MAG: hypothetical protein DI539_06505 [Flavobacterium psychrophilum]
MKPFVLFLKMMMVLFTANLPAQRLVKCNDNTAYWVIPDNNLLYALTLKGDVDLSDNPEIINSNNTAIQYILLQKPYATDSEKDDEALLTRHIESERQRLKKIFNTPSLTVDSKIIFLPKMGKKAVFWYFELPEGFNNEVVAQLFMHVVIGEKLFGLGTPLFKGYDFETALSLVINTLDSLTVIKNTESLCY